MKVRSEQRGGENARVENARGTCASDEGGVAISASPPGSTAVLGLLILDAMLVGALGVAFAPLYIGAVPAPLSVPLTMLILVWLVRRAAEIDPRPTRAAAPLYGWGLTVAVLGFTAPGRGGLLAPTWQSLLLLVGGVGAGLWELRRLVDTADQRGDHDIDD